MNSKILVYLRPRVDGFNRKLADYVFGSEKKVFLSDFNGLGDIWVGSCLYDKKNDLGPQLFTEDELFDIFFRCRFLRTLPILKGFKFIQKTALHFESILDKHDPKAILSYTIDTYTLDILERLAKRRGIPVIAIVAHFFNGYSRISNRGETSLIERPVNEEEIDKVLEDVGKVSYKPDYDVNREKRAFDAYYFFYREKFKEHIYFPIKKIVKSEKYNYHYNTLGFRKRRFKEFYNSSFYNYFSKEIKSKQNLVYIPLHLTPECTVDYWTDDYRCANYEDSILRVIDNSSPDISFIVKEHPACFMIRNIEFYEKLHHRKNVQLGHPYLNSNKLLEKVKSVYVYTGSVGVEALLRGKRVISRTRNYYSDLHPNIKILDKLTLEDISRPIEPYDNRKFARSLLSGLIPFRFLSYFDATDEEIMGMATFIKNSLIK